MERTRSSLLHSSAERGHRIICKCWLQQAAKLITLPWEKPRSRHWESFIFDKHSPQSSPHNQEEENCQVLPKMRDGTLQFQDMAVSAKMRRNRCRHSLCVFATAKCQIHRCRQVPWKYNIIHSLEVYSRTSRTANKICSIYSWKASCAFTASIWQAVGVTNKHCKVI